MANGEDVSTGIEKLEVKISRVETMLILLAIGAIAWGDYIFGQQVSLGYLYLVPLSYSALTHRPRTTILLMICCVLLRQAFGPIQFSSWGLIARDWILTGIFLSVVVALHRLGKARRSFFEQARRQRDELSAEIRMAAEVQQHLMSRHTPPVNGIEIVARMLPLRTVGGDYYDFIRLDQERFAVVIADVSGKGLPAALLMPAVQISLRSLTARFDGIAQILAELNAVLYEAIERATYVTLFYGSFDLKHQMLTFSNAGHQPVLWLKRDALQAEWLSDGGPPAGLLPGVTYAIGSVDLNEGDILVFYTDGVVESCNSADELFGAERLADVVAAHRTCSCEQIVEAVITAAQGFAGSVPLADDLTIIAVRIPAPSAPGEER